MTLWTVLSGLQAWARENPHPYTVIRPNLGTCDLCGRTRAYEHVSTERDNGSSDGN